MGTDTEEEKKFKVIEKLKGFSSRVKEKIKLNGEKKKRRTLSERFLSKKEKPKPIKKRIIELLSQLKEISIRIKGWILALFNSIKMSIIGIKDSIVGFFFSISNIPKVTSEKTTILRETTKALAKKTSIKTKSFWEKIEKRIEESPLFIKKHLINVKPVEKSLMITADNSAVFYWIKDEAKRIDKKLPVEVIDKNARIKKLREEILEGLDTKPLSQTLIKCIELAGLTGNYKDIDWMKKELKGYVDDKKFIRVGKNYPDYRKIRAILPVNWYIKGEYSLTNEDINVPFYCVKPVQWIEENIARCKKTRSKEIITKLPIPGELYMIKNYFKKDMITVITPIISLEYILNRIKIRVHEFMFKVTAGKFKKKKKKRKKHLKQ